MRKRRRSDSAVTVWIKQKLSSSSDFVNKEMGKTEVICELLYLSSTCEEAIIDKQIIEPYYVFETEESYIDYLLSHSGSQFMPTKEEALTHLLTGSVLIQLDNEFLTIKALKTPLNKIEDATTERVVMGPKSGLSEDLGTNLTMMRGWYTSPNLKIEVIGGKVGVMYDQTLSDQKLVQQITNKLKKHQFYRHQNLHHLANILMDEKKILFPRINQTERKDRLALSLTEGKLLLFIEGTPFALILPAPLFDMMHSMSDFYNPYWVSLFIKILRYAGCMITLILPALYVAITSYNPDVFRIELTLSIAGTRLGVPYPSFVEVLLMLSMMEILTEASVRLPEAIGPTATTVGGLILGQAATQAGLVSNIMIIVVASVAISNYAIPNIQLAYAFRVIKYFTLGLTILAGLLGMMIGLISIIAYLCQLESFGTPYLKLFSREKDILLSK